MMSAEPSLGGEAREGTSSICYTPAPSADLLYWMGFSMAKHVVLEVELRRLSSAPAPSVQTREPVQHAVHQPAQQSAHQPPQHSASHQPPQHSASHQPPQHPVHQPPQHSAHQPVQHSSHQPQPQPQKQPEQPLADFLVRKLNEVGAMSLDDLRRLALQEGYFADAGLDVHNALFNVVKAGLIRQLPGGDFAPATIRLRRAM